MQGDGKRVVDAFAAWLEAGGWTTEAEAGFVDVLARRGSECLYAEAKGSTPSPGLDVDTAYGQLLRRMGEPGAGNRYALVVPTAAVRAALRVAPWVRERLGIEVFEVDDAGSVHRRS